MPNGRPFDHPIADLLIHDRHPFPSDMEAMIRTLHGMDPSLLRRHDIRLAALDWEKGRNLEDGRALLKALIAKHAP